MDQYFKSECIKNNMIKKRIRKKIKIKNRMKAKKVNTKKKLFVI